MRVRFADGSEDDWPTYDFVQHDHKAFLEHLQRAKYEREFEAEAERSKYYI